MATHVEAHYVASAIGEFKRAIAEMAVVRFHPGAQGVVFVDARIAVYLQADAAEHPSYSGCAQLLVAHFKTVGMAGGYLYDTFHEQCYGRERVGVALACREVVVAVE